MTMPLNEIRVLDLTRLLPGPYCTLMLADFGAEVIKVEEPGLGDYARWEEPMVSEDKGAMFHSLNRNKKSVTLNLKSDSDKSLFIELVKSADVLVESFRPGVMGRLGLDYETLKEVNKKLIYCAITGYGQTGPYAKKPGHDLNYLSYAGVIELQGEEERVPVSSSTQIADLAGGAQMAINGILLALMERTKSGKGQFVDISMLDGSISLMQTLLPKYLYDRQLPGRGKTDLAGGKAAYRVYKTADGRFISVAALEPKFWVEFCDAIEKPELLDFLTKPIEDQRYAMDVIQNVIQTKTLHDWMDIFENLDACVAPLLNLEEVTENTQVKAREMIVKVKEGIDQIGIPIKLSRTPGQYKLPSASLGEHNTEILGELSAKF